MAAIASSSLSLSPSSSPYHRHGSFHPIEWRISSSSSSSSSSLSLLLLLHSSTLRSSKPPNGNHTHFIARASAKKQALPSLAEQLSSNPHDEMKWKEARIPLLNLGLSESDADLAMAKSFGWASSPYWGEEKTKSMPDSHIIQKTVSFLRSLGLSDEDLVAFLKKFPEALGCKVEDEMEKNVKILEKEWGISGNTLKNLLRRNPKSLGYNVDCKGDCIAQCTRCWVRF